MEGLADTAIHNLHFIRQKLSARGLFLWRCSSSSQKHLSEMKPFVVMLGDDSWISLMTKKAFSFIKQLINDYETHASALQLLTCVPHEERSFFMYGVILKAKAKMDVIALKLSLKNQIQRCASDLLLSVNRTALQLTPEIAQGILET